MSDVFIVHLYDFEGRLASYSAHATSESAIVVAARQCVITTPGNLEKYSPVEIEEMILRTIQDHKIERGSGRVHLRHHRTKAHIDKLEVNP